MKRLIVATALLGLTSTGAFSMPLLNQASSMAHPADWVQNVHVVCEENGFCYQVGRPLVARWIYGDRAFSGPYSGPRYYGAPNRRYKWSIFSPWDW